MTDQPMDFAAPSEVAVCYHRDVAGAADLAERLAAQARAAGRRSWVHVLPLPGDGDGSVEFCTRLATADLLVCVGGDGTVLHASEFAAQTGTAIFGVRMGRLGFLTETVEADAEASLAEVLRGHARIERHAMVQARVGEAEPMHALNDVVIGRAILGKTISVGASIEGVLVAEYRADAVVVATATGSTGYSLSVGGPILHPSSDDMILVAVAPHLTRANPLVLQGDARLRLFLERGDEALLTVDGLHQSPVTTGTVVEVSRSPRTARFVRLGGPERFYDNIAKRLGWLRADHALGDLGEERPPRP
ncbi:MAG: NAD(+)/NADH kinase [Dehalococcoidia bacterium]